MKRPPALRTELTWGEQQFANAPHRIILHGNDGKPMRIYSDRPIAEAVCDAFRVAAKMRKPVPSVIAIADVPVPTT